MIDDDAIVIYVPKSRVEHNYETKREGDISRAYSADTLSEGKGRIRKPFMHRQKIYTNTGGCSGGDSKRSEWTCYEIIPLELYKGETITYHDRISLPSDNPRRYSREGEPIKYQGKPYVLTNKTIFVYDPKHVPNVATEVVQLALFEEEAA